MFPFFFFNDTATTEIYTLSLHDALPICCHHRFYPKLSCRSYLFGSTKSHYHPDLPGFWLIRIDKNRSEEHTSELQSRRDLVCRLLLEKKKNITSYTNHIH